MKSQIALIGVGLAIAAGVAYAELKPANNAPTAPVVSTPKPSKSNTPAPAATPTKSKIVTKAKTPAPKKSAAPKIATPTNSKPSISGGGGEREDDEHEGGEEGDD